MELPETSSEEHSSTWATLSECHTVLVDAGPNRCMRRGTSENLCTITPGDTPFVACSKPKEFPETVSQAEELQEKLKLKRKRGRYRTCCFWFVFVIFAFTGPIFLNATKLLDAQTVFNTTGTGITILTLGEIDALSNNCSFCTNNRDSMTSCQLSTDFLVTFDVKLQFSLSAPPRGHGIILFASNDGVNWYTGAVSTNLQVVLDYNQTLTIIGGCYGDPGPLWMVACLARTASLHNFEQGRLTWNPPFDDRCAVIGAKCGVSCGGFYAGPKADQYCENGTIPYQYLVSEASGGALRAVRVRNVLPSILLSLFIAFSLLSVFLEMVEAAPALCKDPHQRIPKIKDLQRVNFGFPEMESQRILLACFTPCAGEGDTIILRSMLSVITSIIDFKLKYDAGDVFSSHHYLADDTAGHKYFNLFAFLRDKFASFDPLLLNGMAMASREKIIAMCEDPEKWSKKEKMFFPPGDPYHDLWTQWLAYQCDPEIKVADLGGQQGTESFIDEEFCVTFYEIGSDDPINIVVHYIWWEKTEKGTKSGKANKLKLVGDVVKKQFTDIYLSDKFIAILDARHAPTPEFWEVSLPHFWKDEKVISRNYSVRASQENQFFPFVHRRQDDYLDREHGHYYNLLMPVRDMGGVTTSAGTNSIWHFGDYHNKRPFEFPTETMSEDTELSHMVILRAEKIRFIGLNTVKGCAKSEKNYIDAVARWSAGGVELMALAFTQRHPVIMVYFLFFLIYFAVMALILAWKDNQIVLWFVQAVIVIVFCVLARHNQRFQALLVIFSNTIFWFTGSLSALWWVLTLPLCLSFGVDFRVNVLVLLIGTLVTLCCQSIISRLTKWWGGAREIHFWRAYQMWALLWPLNFMAPYWAWRGKNAWSSVYRVYIQLVFIVIQLVLHIVGIIVPIITMWIRYSDGKIDVVEIVSDSRLMGALVSFWMLVSVWDPAWALLLGKPLQISSRQVLMGGMIVLLAVYLFISGTSTATQQLSVLIPTFVTPTWFRTNPNP